MKPITFIAILACLTISNIAMAQLGHFSSKTTFFKNNGHEVNQLDSADFIRVVSAPDSGSKLYNVNEYYPDKSKRTIAKSWNPDNMQFEGQATWFFPDGKKKEMCNYHEARKKGDDYLYYPNGKIYLHKKYLSDDEKIAGNDVLFLDYRDSTGTGTNLATDGNGIVKVYDDKFTYVFEEGQVKNGLRDGDWKGENGDKDTHMSFSETYDNGTLKTGKAFYSKENKTYTYTVREAMPQFFGGIAAFSAYLGQNIKYPGVSRFNKTQGRVIVAFVVERDGKLSDFKVLRYPDMLMAKEAVRVLSESPNWVPGYQFGKAVRVSYTVPINFTL